jgi:hypothetical protein
VLAVIARKVSFGSQSDAGAKTREVLTTLVQTLKKRVTDPEAHLKSVLDKLAANRAQHDLVSLLFPQKVASPILPNDTS